jgi:acetyl esterase/lipase
MAMNAIHRALAPLLLLALLLGLGGCSAIDVLNAITPASDYRRLQNIPFDAGDLRLDVYRPAHARQAPVVVFLYGGSWEVKRTYTKDEYKFIGEALAARGYVVLIPDYRLYPNVRYPAFIEDNAKAVVWAHAHAGDYGGDADKLVLLGHSAGAYNAAMLTLNPSYLQQAGGERSWIKAMIGLAGPYDFLPLTDPLLDEIFAPARPLESSQPINYVDGRNPPMLLMAGENDDIVFVKNTNNLYAKIKALNGPVEKVVYPKMSHIKIIITTATRLQGQSDVMAHIVDFIQRKVGTGVAAQ